MKKYLMIGFVAAVAFSSCSNHDIETMSQEQIIKAQYEANFVAQFGQPASNQDWGFGASTRAFTREANVNGNQWHDGVNYNYEYDAKVTVDEKNKVFNYVNNPTNVETVNQIPYTEYWVAQIWNGNKDANASNVKAPTSTSYPNQNGATTTIIGGAQMDKLEIKETADGGWIHCNNFNAADNNDWKEGGEGGRTLMTQSGTYSFRYTNSQSSYLSEKYIIVPGEKIDASLAGFYYVCFDFEKGYTDTEKAAETTFFYYTPTDNNGYDQAEQKISLSGYYASNNIPTDAILSAVQQNNSNYVSIKNVRVAGYMYGDKHCDGDDNYTDWIVRISPAQVKSNYDLRIIAEDLNANQSDNDWDFNDIVLDIKYGTTAETTKVILRAAGGTMKLRIAENDEWEVHKLFDVDVNTMVNTNWTGSNSAKKDPVVVPYDKAIPNAAAAKALKLEVFKNGTWQELTANTGEPACKIGVKPSFQWLNERASIKKQYPEFTKWVTQDPTIIWY